MTTSLTANLILQKTKLDHLRHVRRLNVCGAQVSHIHVLRDAINVEVLSLSVNQIEDLSPLSFLEELRELYLRKNKISDLMQVLHLSQLEQLTVLGMSENPISIDPSYRPFVIAAIPTLWKLDDIEITPTERRQAEVEFSEIRHWAPPDPIPFSQIGVSPQSNVSSPRRVRGNTDERDNLASTYGGNGAHTARRRHAHQINDDDRDDPYSRVPATARKPSTASPIVPAHAHKSHTHTKHNPNSDQPISSSARGGDGGANGWDDVPVGGGGGARGKRPSASSATTAGGGIRVEGDQHSKVESDQGVGGSSILPVGTSPSPSPSSSSSLRPPPINLASAAQRHIDPSMGAGGDHLIRHDKTRRESAVSAKVVGVKAFAPVLDDRSDDTLHRASPAMEESIVSAVKLLLDQLSPSAVEEVLRYAASKRR